MKQNLYEVFYIDDLTPEEQENIYDLYKTSYEKSVGNAWDQYKFFERAEDWYFFGDQSGYVATRRQGSGMYKLAVVGGNVRGILKGMQELTSLNEPIWGMVSSDILPMMKKLGFKTPNALTMNALLRLIPKEVFGGVDFKINLDGSITLNYEDTGSARKYFVGNQQYFDWLKSQIKNKINPLKLTNLLKEILNEAKQIGNIYHFTPINYCIKILKDQYIQPNYEQKISTTRYANSDVGFISHGETDIMCRIMLDGDKISNTYKIKGYVHPADVESTYGDDEDDDYEDRKIFLSRKGAKGKYAEEAIDTKGERFYLLPYVKRIDVFIEKNTNKKQQKYLETLKNLLNKMSIPYELYEGTPKSNTPYKQSKEGDPSKFIYKQVLKPKYISIKQLYIPWKVNEIFTINPNPETYPINEDDVPFILSSFLHYLISSPNFPDFYIIDNFMMSKIENENSSDLITNKILKSLKIKSVKELGFEDTVKKHYDSLKSLYKSITIDTGTGEKDDYLFKNINNYLDREVILIPKDIIDKYFIKTPKSQLGVDFKRKGILKK